LVAVQGKDHPLLWSESLVTESVHWLVPPQARRFACSVKTRYRQPDVRCDVQIDGSGGAEVFFHAPVWAVTPGQYAVFYADDECLGGAVISSMRQVTGTNRKSAAAGSA
jgi:tRNA-specific 2-thiouridylase